jgi:hypothetical protein
MPWSAPGNEHAKSAGTAGRNYFVRGIKNTDRMICIFYGGAGWKAVASLPISAHS